MKKLAYLAGLLGMLSACVDNDSRYGGIEIDAIEISGIEAYREIEIGDRLTVQPTVTTKFGGNSDLSYVWYKYNQEQVVADTLSFEKDLDVVIGDVLPGVETTLVLKVTDNATGVFAMHRSKFKTLGKYTGGTLMLCRNDGQCDLCMLKKDGETLYEDIYAIANDGEKLGADSKRVLLTRTYTSNPMPYKAVIVTCDDRTGGVYLDPDAFVRKSYMRDKFLFAEDLPEKLSITANYNSYFQEILLVNGKVYGRSFGNSDVADWNPEVVFQVEPYDYEMADFVLQPANYSYYADPLCYDNLNGRFAGNLKDNGYFSVIAGDNNDYSKFDPNALGANMKLVAAGYLNRNMTSLWSLMKDTDAGEYVLLTFKFDMDWYHYPYKVAFYSQSRQTVSRDVCPALYEAVAFSSGSKAVVTAGNSGTKYAYGIYDFLFYLSGNKVYAFNVNAGSEGVVVDGDAENYAITGVDCTQVAWPSEDNPNARIDQLTVAVKDRSLSGKQGGIAVYRLESVGGLSAQKVYAKAGFCDEVISTIEKQD